MKKKRMHPILQFILVMLAGGIVGACVAMLTSPTTVDPAANRAALLHGLTNIYNLFFPWGYLILNILVLFILIYRYRILTKTYRTVLADDSDALEKPEEKLSRLSFPLQLFLLLNVFLFFSAAIMMEKNDALLFAVPIFLLASVLILALERGIVLTLRRGNPEKDGDPFEWHFRKKWMNSFDEAEKAIAHECGFSAFSTSITVSYLLLPFILLLYAVFNVGLLALALVTFQIFVLQCAYQWHYAKMRRS